MVLHAYLLPGENRLVRVRGAYRHQTDKQVLGSYSESDFL